MFSDKYGLTKAVLEGRKTQTRRIIKIDDSELSKFREEYYNASLDLLDRRDLIEAYFSNNPKKIHYKVGEVVAIAQSYENAGIDPTTMLGDGSNGFIFNEKGWTNKMFVKAELMPHQIRITKVRIEKLQDISDEDCLAEGIEFDGKAQSFYCGMNISTNAKTWLGHTPRIAYASLIDKVGKRGDWESNPYVFVYDFELIK